MASPTALPRYIVKHVNRTEWDRRPPDLHRQGTAFPVTGGLVMSQLLALTAVVCGASPGSLSRRSHTGGSMRAYTLRIVQLSQSFAEYRSVSQSIAEYHRDACVTLCSRAAAIFENIGLGGKRAHPTNHRQHAPATHFLCYPRRAGLDG